MRGNEFDSPSVERAINHSGGDILSLFAEVHARLSKVEADNAEMRAQIDAAKKGGDLDFDTAHAVHVLNKHFFHDKPEPPAVETPRAKFDAFTGERLN